MYIESYLPSPIKILQVNTGIRRSLLAHVVLLTLNKGWEGGAPIHKGVI